MKDNLKALSYAKQSRLVDKVAHVGDGEIDVRNEYHLTVPELVDFMLDHGYERCPKCRWFVETGDLLNENSEPKGGCSNCKPESY